MTAPSGLETTSSSVSPRSFGPAALGVAGFVVFEGSRVLARRRLHAVEVRVFRCVNGAPDRLRVPVRAVMQAGTFATVPIVAAVLGLAGRRRIAAEIAVGGTAAWILAKAAKPLVGRPRPGRLLASVRTRERIEGDLGWVSGHTAVATTVALTLAPHASGRGRAALGAIVATTAFGRMYVGAHLPLDLAGGAGLGLVVASAMRTAESAARAGC